MAKIKDVKKEVIATFQLQSEEMTDLINFLQNTDGATDNVIAFLALLQQAINS